MKKYEMLCVLPGTLAENEVAPMVEQIKEQLTAQGAEDVVILDLGKSRLAYPIKHIRYGYFELFTFNLDPVKVQVLERNVRLLGGILRVSIHVHNPKQKATITLASDPTALSAPPREDVRDRSRTETKREVVAKDVVATEESEEAKPKLNLENIDAKLDELLQKDIDNV